MEHETPLCPIESLPDDPLFADEWDWEVRSGARALSIRGQSVTLNLSEEQLHVKGITLLEPPAVDPVAVLRSLLPEHRDRLLASLEELASYNPHRLPLWMRLDEWHHPDLANEELPGQTETFQMLADALASGDPARYAPTLPPNTHWRNWPEGGTL